MDYEKLVSAHEGVWYSEVCPGQLWMEHEAMGYGGQVVGNISTLVIVARSRMYHRDAYGPRWIVVGTLEDGSVYTFDGWYRSHIVKRLL